MRLSRLENVYVHYLGSLLWPLEKGKKKHPKTAITYFRPFHLFSTTASDYCGRTSPNAISSTSSSGMFDSLLFFISPPLHLIRLRTTPRRSAPPTAPRPPPPFYQTAPQLSLSSSLPSFISSDYSTASPLFIFYFLFYVKVWELGDLSHPPTAHLFIFNFFLFKSCFLHFDQNHPLFSSSIFFSFKYNDIGAHFD